MGLDITLSVDGDVKSTCTARVAVPVDDDDNPWRPTRTTAGSPERSWDVLDLEFSPEQDMLRETVRKVCATHSPLSVVRELEDDPVGYPTDLWKQMAELDLIGLLLPEEHGGSGMSALEGVVLYEELGRALAPTPHFASAVLCGGALARAGSDAQRVRWLGPIAAGEAIVTPGVVRAREQLRAHRHPDAGRARRRRLPPDRDQAPRPLRLLGVGVRGPGPHR